MSAERIPIINKQLEEIRDAILMGHASGADAVTLDALFTAMVDGTNTTKLFREWWPLARAQDSLSEDTAVANRYHTLCRWFTLIGKAWAGKYYTLRGPDYRVNTTGVTTLTPLGDLADKTAAVLATETSTDAFDWADEDPMTWYLRFNGESLTDGTMNVLSVEGVDDAFDISGNTAPVYTGRLGLFKRWFTDGAYEYKTFTTQYEGGFAPWAADVDPTDNSHRPMNWQATFGGSMYGQKLTSGSGFDGLSWERNGNTTAISKSAADGLTAARKWTNYDGVYSDTDLEPILDLWQMRHFDLENSGILEGCTNYNLDYTVAVAETDVKSVVLTVAQGENILIGSFLDVGSAARGGQRARGNVIRKETVTIESTDYCRVTLDVASEFTTESGDHVSTLPWTPGSTEHLPGHKDGSLYNLTNGKTPARIAGVEIIDGGYAVGLDPLWSSDWDSSRTPKSIYTVYAVRDSVYQASSAGDHHENVGTFTGPNSGWQYIKHIQIRTDGMIIPEEAGAANTGSTKWMKSAFDFGDSSGVRVPWRFAYLSGTGGAGLAGATGYSAPSYAYWYERPRLSGSGKKRGEWQAA